jgi:hypothetical protein
MEEIQGATAKEMQDYTPAQTQMIQGLDVSPDTGKFNVAALPGAEGQAPTLQYTPRQGLAPAGPEDYQSTAPSSPITIAPQKMTEFLGQRYEGGLTPERMESLRTRAMANAVSDPRLRQQMLAEATRAEREAAQAPLQQKALEQNVALGGVQLTAAQRAEQQSVANQNAQSALAVMRANNERIDSQILAQVAKEHGADFATLRNDELNQLGFNEKTAAVEMKNLSRDWSKAALGGVPGMNKFLADKFDPDKNDNYTPEVIQTKAGYVVKYGDKILGEYGTHKDINTLVAQVHGKINDDPLGTLKTLASVEASNASAVYHRAAAGLTGVHGQLYGMQIKGLQDQQAAREKVNTLSEQFSGLTTAQKNGPEGRALMRDINVANIKAGGQLSLGTPEPEMTKAQSKSWELLQKSDLWQQLERKNDVPGMNKLLVGRGIDPALVGLPGDAGWVPKPETPAAAKPAAAPAGLATEDKTKYIRSKNVRGDYTYTASPRGLTKAEYKAMDEK